MGKFYSLLLVVLFSFKLSQAQNDSIFNFSLQQAQSYAIEHNVQAKNALLDIEAANKVVWQTTATGLPQINLNANYNHVLGQVAEFSTSSGFEGLFQLIDSLSSNEGIDPTPFFGEPQEAQPVVPRNALSYTVTLSQLIFSGEYIVALQATKVFLQLSENTKISTHLDIKESIANSYIGLLLIQKNIAILDSTILNIEGILHGAEATFKEGLIESTEVDQLKLTMRSMSSAKKSAERQLAAANLLLKINLGLQPESEVQLTQSLDEVMLGLNTFSYDPSQFNVEENINYKMLANQEKSSELQMKREKSMFLPTLSAFYQYQDETEIGFADFSPPHTLGVTLNMPIFSSGQKLAKLAEAKIELQKSRNIKEMQSNMIKVEALNSYNTYQTSKDNYEHDKENVELAKVILDQTEVKFKNGMAQSLDVKLANNQYLESYGNLIMSIRELLASKLALDKIYNKL